MSFIVKNSEISLAVSIVPVSEKEEAHFCFATDFRRYFVEKRVDIDELEYRLGELNAARLPTKKVLQAFATTAPSKSKIEFNDDGLKLELEFKIILNEITQKSERLKIYFMLLECTTIEEVSEYFVNGLVKSVIETIPPTKVNLPEPAFKLDPHLYEAFGSDLSKMLGAKAERDLSQVVVERKVSESNLLGRKRNNKKIAASRQIIKAQTVEVKKFEFKESDSQELELTEDTPSVPIDTQTEEPVIERKRKKPNVKF